MKDYIDEDRIERLGTLTDVSLHHRLIKLGEEFGELSQAYLGYDNCGNASKTISIITDKEQLVLKLLEECCDVINCSCDLLNSVASKEDISHATVKAMFDSKLDKWGTKVGE